MIAQRGTPPYIRKTKKCSGCESPRDRPGQAYCRKCHNRNMKEFRSGRRRKLKSVGWRVHILDQRTGEYRPTAIMPLQSEAETWMESGDRLVKVETFETIVKGPVK